MPPLAGQGRCLESVPWRGAPVSPGETTLEVSVSHNDHTGSTLAAHVRQVTGLNPARCYQCGKCSAGCPMAAEMDFRPHDVLRLIQQNKREQLLSGESLWLCLTCETCTARCPNECDPARVIDTLREMVWRDNGGAGAPRHIRAFHKSFLKQIRRSGRIFEFGLVAGYKMRTGSLFSDVGAVPGMLKRGKLALTPTRIKGLDEIRRIFDKCAAAETDAEEP